MGLSSRRSCATPNRALRNGSTRVPSLLVPSGNSIRLSPVFSRCIIASRLLLVLFERRSTKIVRCALARVLKNGQVATSALATKLPGIRPPSTSMSR